MLHALRKNLPALLLPVLCLNTLASHAATESRPDYSQDTFASEREVYQQAMETIHHQEGDWFRFFKPALRQYPLLPYLEYEQLSKQFSSLPADKIERFLDKHKGEYIARRLQFNWLNYVGKRQQWALFHQFYDDSFANDNNRCYDLRARLALGEDKDTVFRETDQLWQQAYSMPEACDALFTAWKQANRLSPQIIWQRFQNAYAANNINLAKYLSYSLDGEHRVIASKLLETEKYSTYWLTTFASPIQKVHLNSEALARNLKRLSAKHYQQVSEIIENYQLPLEKEDLIDVQKLCAWYMAKESGSLANEWLTRQNDDQNPELLESQLRFALQAKDWPEYQRLFTSLTKDDREKPEWLYWYAVAQQETGQIDYDPQLSAHAIFVNLAKQKHFYGFLAAEATHNEAIELTSSPQPELNISIDKTILQKLSPAMELYFLGDNVMASREWHHVTRNFNQQQWKQAASLASQIQWHERAIHAYAKANLWQAYEQRFPLAHIEYFEKNSNTQAIDKGWLMAMARQESGFSPIAQSAVGAMGVLQLMPATAQRVAKSLGVPYRRDLLKDPSYNIQLGSKYLKDMLKKFDNNYVLATAAYNAGPHRVNEWLSLRPMTDDWAHWVATIPYKETRQYVQNIMAYSMIYQSRLGYQNNVFAKLSTN